MNYMLARLVRCKGMSFLDLQDLATVAAQMDLWRAIVRWCSECDVVLDALEVAAATAVVALVSKRRKIDF